MNQDVLRDISEKYCGLLRAFLLSPEGNAASEQLQLAHHLGGSLVMGRIAPAELLGIHQAAVESLANCCPALQLAQIGARLNMPLVTMYQAYESAFRERIAVRYQDLAASFFCASGEQELIARQIGDVFNDFNTHLGSIIGFAEMVEDELSRKSSGQQSLHLLMQNLTALLKAEHAIQQRIRSSERQFRTLVDNSPDVILRYDMEGRCVFANPAFTRETGLMADQDINTILDRSANRRWDDESCSFGERVRQVAATGVADVVVLEWRHPQGHLVSHEMHIVPEYDADEQIFGTLAIGRDVTRRKEVEFKLRHQANYDPLSGLPNRRLLGDMLQREVASAKKHAYPLAVVFIDLDRFKDVNDSLGHSVGDQLLVVAAQRVRASVREHDLVARLAGDEFVAVLPRLEASAALTRIGDDIVAALAEPFQLGEHRVRISASVGIAIYPHDADTVTTLIGCADQAMFAAKGGGRNGLAFFTEDMREKSFERRRLLNDLYDALQEGQFELHFQPALELQSGVIHKAEALVRWRHPAFGMISPDRFIPLAEESGLIFDLGRWILQEAARVSVRWNAQGTSPFRKQISVNLSPVQFLNGHYDAIVMDQLSLQGCQPGLIAIEITEGLLLDDSEAVRSQLNNLRAAGIQVALDDFGTGYSAMSYLKKFSMDYLKIDRSFVQDMVDADSNKAIVEAIIVMAHRLGMKVIAEGVETMVQAQLLRDAGCEYVQGYLYSRPLPEDDFLNFAASAHSPADAAAAR
ncbi:EAL domain-containing protein [Herbaspirillum seropedicae]|uniref:Signal transduction protein containing a membrane domain, an EAL and a GGDEF domain protein n=1 Tax=Herbaspirillum seropedicae (strain SmR1) TaxID=757424 RepID=D8IQV9_HERSS|nr:bifunctional diguanylate cyclase/phosphodiesterase [Herbaspirillum seropedicae]ADJ63220.1 signal transduction protein containing a membrane domain, an EAL and a GGDEF domain protein [Herbaspirillum seropedicae SmR1]UMU21230.1 EAL domain-containing protein [Herbaspirillum seropedicae]